MIRLKQREGSVVELEATGEITHEDYEAILPKLDEAIEEQGELDCLIYLHHLKSIEFKAVMDDLKFDVRHATDFGRIALVTSKDWHRWATKFWAAFIPDVKLKCFDPSEMVDAREWVRGTVVSSAG